MPEPIVDIYCRRALDDQHEPPPGTNTLDDQEQACRAYCNEHGLTVSMVFREIGTAYQYRERPRLSQMRQHILNSEIQGIVVTTVDRLSKNLVDLVILLEEMEQHNVTFYAASEELDKSPLWCYAKMASALTAHIRQEKAE
jgi:site-specific DNA recombinase